MSAPSKSTSPSKERALGSRSLNDKGDAGLKKSAVDVEKGRDTAVAGNSPQCKADVTVPRFDYFLSALCLLLILLLGERRRTCGTMVTRRRRGRWMRRRGAAPLLLATVPS